MNGKLIMATAVAVTTLGVVGSANAQIAEQKELRLQERQQLKQERQQLKQERQEMRAQFKKEKEFYKESRTEFQRAKEVRAEFRTADKQKRQQMLASAPGKLQAVIDRMIARLNKVKNWANNRGVISEAQKAQINAQIDKDIAWLTAKKNKVEGVSPEEIKTHLKEVREYWRNNRLKTKQITGQVLVARADKVLERADKVSARIDDKIAQFEAAGKDVAAAKKLAADFDAKVALAKDKVAQAKKSFAATSNLKEVNSAFVAGHKAMKEARTYLRQARQVAQQIVAELKK